MERARKFLCERYATDDVQEAYKTYLGEYDATERAEMPEQFEELVPVRWCFKAPPGYCFVDMDYATAEVWSLGFLANDKKLIQRLTSEDPQFVLCKQEDEKIEPVRVAYVEGVTQFSKDQWDPKLVHTLEELGDLVVRDEAGKPKHPKRDIHWEMAEHKLFMNKPREKLSKSKDRAAGKISNFQAPYQASPGLLERLIEVNTGVKQEVGTGERLLEAYKSANPRCWEFLEETMQKVETDGFYQSPFGCKRHFKTLQGMDGVSKWRKENVLTGLKRQASNYPMQSLVSCFLARAVVGLLDAFREKDLDAKIVCALYDAVYVVSPIKDKEIVWELMEKHLSEENYIDLPGGRLQLGLDGDVTKRWSTEPTEEEKKELNL